MAIPRHSLLDRMALAIFNTPFMWGFFIFINLFTFTYITYEDFWDLHPFDPYPFTLLNLILAIFVAEMDILIVIAQLVAAEKTDYLVNEIAAIVHQNDLRDAMIQTSVENTLAVMRAIHEMAVQEAQRDSDLHELIREGHYRGVVLERLLREVLELLENDKSH